MKREDFRIHRGGEDPAKARPIEDVRREHEENRREAAELFGERVTATQPDPLQPLADIGLLVEEARAKLLEAAKIADGVGPAIHMPVQAARLEVERCQQELTSWTARDGE